MNKILFLSSLRGCPLSIIICLLLFKNDSDVIFNETFISKSTGYSIKTCRVALQYLESINLVYRVSRYSGFKPSDYLLSLFTSFFPTTTTTTIGSVNPLTDYFSKVEEEITDRPVIFTAQNEVILYLKSQNVGEPTRTILANLPWVNLEYLKSHFDYGYKRNDPIGLIIHRIKSHDDKPKTNSDSQMELIKRTWGKTS